MQKTAYEMRISVGSSDVCSSDLGLCKRSQQQAVITCHQCRRHRQPARTCNKMIDPRTNQTMPFTGLGGANTVGYGADGENRAISTLVQATQQTLDAHTMQLQADDRKSVV